MAILGPFCSRRCRTVSEFVCAEEGGLRAGMGFGATLWEYYAEFAQCVRATNGMASTALFKKARALLFGNAMSGGAVETRHKHTNPC